MELSEAITKAHVMLQDHQHCIYHRDAWVEVIAALLPAAEAQLARAQAAQGKQ